MALKHAKSAEVVDLKPLGDKLKGTKTSAIIKAEHFEAIRLVVHAGMTIATHEVAGNVMLHCLEGHVRLGLSDGQLDLMAGEWVFLDRSEDHSIAGIEDSCVLMTILFPHKSGSVPGM
ncbi:MAG: cupin [Alphaproteobacteria bacterium]|nr:cupin [Alphaproteobacteria bacterium]